MAKDINIHIKTRGAEQTKQQLEDVGRKSRQVGDKTAEGASTGSAGIDKLTSSAEKGTSRFANFASSIKSWVFGLVGISAIIGGITRAIQIQKQALEEHARIAAEQQKKFLALMGMGTFFERHPKARKEISEMAEFGRRPFEEVAESWYQLESKGAGLTEAQKKGIMHEALELGRMEPEADLKSIIDVFSLYAKETREKDINQIQNVLRQTLSQAGAELSQIGQYLPRFLSLGIAGGLTGAETAGLWAYATTRAANVEQATVGIRNIFSALRAEGTPEAQKLLEQLGVTKEMDIFEQLARLSQAQKAGKFGVPEAEKIAGKENIAVLLSMLTEPEAMMETVRSITEVARPDIDLVKTKLEQIMSKDEIARLEEEGRRLDVAITNIKSEDIEALRKVTQLKEYERRLREADVAEYRIQLALAFERLLKGFGIEIPASLRTTGPIGGPSVEFPEKESLGIVSENISYPTQTETPSQKPSLKEESPKEAEKSLIQKTGEGLKNIYVPSGEKPKAEQKPPVEESPLPPISKEVEVPVKTIAKETSIEVPVIVSAGPQQVEVPIEAIAKETEVEIPAVAAAQQIEVPIEAMAERAEVEIPAVAAAQQIEVPVEATAGRTEVEVPAVAAAQQIEVPVEAVTESQQVEVPVQPTAKEAGLEIPVVVIAPDTQRVGVPVETAVEKQEVEVPIEVATSAQRITVPVEAEPQAVPIIAPSAQPQEKVIHQTVNNFNYVYDHSIRFHPRVGDDESGPRIAPGVVV